MRADRLIAALLLMQARGRVTAAELAGELEVSVATARRDLEALSGAGIPVYPQPGRGGGWSLLGGAHTDLSGLSATEAQALFLLIGPAAVSGEAKAALRKLVRALPQSFRAGAEAAASATVIDPTRWGERDRRRPEAAALLEAAVIGRRKVRLTYVGSNRESTERLVDPWGLVDKDDIWYLIAGTERGQRTFRIDRIIAAEPTDQPADRPDDFSLAAAWEEVAGEVEQRRSRTWATVLKSAVCRIYCSLQDSLQTEDLKARWRRVLLPWPPPRAAGQMTGGPTTTYRIGLPPHVHTRLLGLPGAGRRAAGHELRGVQPGRSSEPD